MTVRSYQVRVGVDSPLTLRPLDGPDDREAMFVLVNAWLSEISVQVAAFARERLGALRQTAAGAGYALEIPSLTEPMGASSGLQDVTGHVGARWRPRDAGG